MAEGVEKIYEFTVRRADESTFEQCVIVREPEGEREALKYLRDALDIVARQNRIVSEGRLIQIGHERVG